MADQHAGGSQEMLKRFLMAVAVATSLVTGLAHAAWPSKPIRIMVPWPAPNDPTTLIAHAMAPVMAKELGVPVKVVNQPGGHGVLATARLAHSRPDGYEVGLISIGPVITQVLRGKTPYTSHDLQPLGLLWSSPFALAARAGAPYSNLKELAAYGKKHQLRLAHWGLGTVPTLIAMQVAEKGGFKWQATAYSKLNPILVVQHNADVITFSTPGLKDYVDAGKLKILAAMLPTRLPSYPKVPTVAEQGFGDGFSVWFGAFVPKGTNPAIVQKLSHALFGATANPKVAAVIKRVGVVPDHAGPKATRVRMDQEMVEFRKLMKEVGIIK